MNKSALSILLLALLGTATQGAQGSQLGRLFYTPQQRQRIEYEGTGSESEAGKRRNYIVVNGVVQKKGGNRTVWINGTAQPAERGNDKPPSTASVNVPGKSRPVHLKVGQKLLLENPAPEQDK